MNILSLDDNFLQRELFKFIDTRSLLQLGRTCNKLKKLVENDSLWEERGKILGVHLTKKAKSWRVVVAQNIGLVCCECGFNKGKYSELNDAILCYVCREKVWYRLITKTRAKRELGLNDKELMNLKTIECDNPRYKRASPMVLCLEREAKALAIKKYGSLENLSEKRTKRKRKQQEKIQIKKSKV